MNKIMCINNKLYNFAALCLGLAFTGHLLNLWWFEPRLGLPAMQDVYDLSTVLAVFDSPVWIFGGLMHLLAAASMSVLALPESDSASPVIKLTGVAAILGSTCFLLLSMTNFIGMPEIEATAQLCEGDSRTALVGYNLVRGIALGGAMFALGAFLLLGSSNRLQSGSGSRLVHAVGLIAGLLSMLFAFSAAPSLVITTLTMASVVIWGLSHGLAGRGPGRS